MEACAGMHEAAVTCTTESVPLPAIPSVTSFKDEFMQYTKLARFFNDFYASSLNRIENSGCKFFRIGETDREIGD